MNNHSQQSSFPKSHQLTIKIRKLAKHADLPTYGTEHAAGLDLIALDYRYDHDNKFHEYGTGLAIEIPPGYEGDIRPRSSIRKTSLTLINSPGTIDADYRGEIIVCFKEVDDREVLYNIGDKIAQLVILPVPKIKLVEVEELSDTNRGNGGFGSTGR